MSECEYGAGGARRILITSPSWIGDAVIALPAVNLVRRRNPSAFVAVLAKPRLQELWKLVGAVDEVLVQVEGLRGTGETARSVREYGFDMVYIVPNSFRSALIPWLAGVPRRVGFRGHFRSWMLTEIVDEDPQAKRHQMYEVLQLVQGGDIEDVATTAKIDLDPAEVESVRKKYDLPECAVGFVPGAARGPSKRWPAEHYVVLGRRLVAECGMSILIFGSRGEKRLCEEIAHRIGAQARNLAGETGLREWAATMRGCAGVVSNDSGGMHLAAALGIPVVGVFGITDPAKTGPIGEQCKVLQKSELRGRDIPRNSVLARKCLESVTPEDVYSALFELVDFEENNESRCLDEHRNISMHNNF